MAEMTEDQQFLSALALTEIERIRAMQIPVVRVCGPLSCDGPEGYQRNADRLTQAELILERRGISVWKLGDYEDQIRGKNFIHSDVINYFHQPILKSGLLKEAFFLPRWQESTGSVKERDLAERMGIEIQEFPEAWFETEV